MLYGWVEVYNVRRKTKAEKDGKYLHKMTLSKEKNQSATTQSNESCIEKREKKVKYFE